MDQRQYDALSAAIAVLTADFVGEGSALSMDTLLSYVNEGDLSDAELVVGFRTLALVLLVKMEQQGTDPLETLRDVAERYRPGA